MQILGFIITIIIVFSGAFHVFEKTEETFEIKRIKKEIQFNKEMFLERCKIF